MALCSTGHRRCVPLRLLQTDNDDETPLYSRPFKCFVCGSSEVMLFAIEIQVELDEVRSTFLQQKGVARGIGVRASEPEDLEARFL